MNLVPTQLTLWENVVQLRYNEIQCKALEPLCLFTASAEKWTARMTFKRIWFGLILIHRLVWIFSAVLGLSYCCVFWHCGFDLFYCSFLVSLCRTLLDQVCWVRDMVSVWYRSCQWTVEYWRENELVSTLLTLWENAVRFLNKRNAVQHTLAALLVHS